MIFWIITNLLFSLGYLLLFAWFGKGWKNLSETRTTRKIANHKTFTVLIPVRNEEEHIVRLLQSIKDQKYPKDKFEVLLINDSSEDNTEVVVAKFIRKNPELSLQMFHLRDQGKTGKKEALNFGVEKARFSNIITVDGDCCVPPRWLQAYHHKLQERKHHFVSGPIAYFESNNFFKNCLDIECKGLVTIGGASIQNKKPNLCNGANLMFTKEAFCRVNGYQGNQHLASGDDEFLLQKMVALGTEGIGFLRNPEAIVKTQAPKNFKEFYHQRKRWVSKSRHYNNPKLTLLLSMLYLYNFFLVLSFCFSMSQPMLLIIALCFLFTKALIEYRYLYLLNFFSFRRLFPTVLLAQPFYILYVLVIGILGNWGTFVWKGRVRK